MLGQATNPIAVVNGRGAICREVLEALPEWFGIPTAAEVYVMGVKRPWHRRGIGRALIEGVVQLAMSQGIQFLTVKTLSPLNDDPNYARTRLFYEAVGFLPIEEFPTLWGPENPCIFMLRPIRSG